MSQIHAKLIELETQIKNAYLQYSPIDTVCNPIAISPDIRYGHFSQFASRLLIPRQHITESSHFLILSEIGTSVARGERKHLVEYFSEHSPSQDVESISYDEIARGVETVRSQGFIPNHIFLPIDYFHNVFEWNRGRWRPDTARGSAVDTLYIDNIQLQISYSNKYIPFQNAIITSREANIWEYRPVDENGGGRLTAKFEWDYPDSENTILLVKTIFNLAIRNREGNFVIKPRNLPTSQNTSSPVS